MGRGHSRQNVVGWGNELARLQRYCHSSDPEPRVQGDDGDYTNHTG